DLWARFDAYRACQERGMSPEDASEALLAAAPSVASFIGRLFGIEDALHALRGSVMDREPLWRFKRDFAKKRILRPDAGKAWREGPGKMPDAPGQPRATVEVEARAVALAALRAAEAGAPSEDEELFVAKATLLLHEVDETARKAAKSGGAQWTNDLRARA